MAITSGTQGFKSSDKLVPVVNETRYRKKVRAGEGYGLCVGLDQSGGNYKDCGKS